MIDNVGLNKVKVNSLDIDVVRLRYNEIVINITLHQPTESFRLTFKVEPWVVLQ